MAQLLLEQLQGGGPEGPPRSLVQDVELVVRESA